MKHLRPVCLLALALSFARAGTPDAPGAGGFAHDLGQGLAYHRILRLPADLPTGAASSGQPAVLDLRYVRATNGDAAALEAWVRFRATPRTPILILANADTTPVLVAPFVGRAAAGSVIVIGAAAPGFAPDIAVAFNRTGERRAYDALGDGTDLAALLNDAPEKVRNDEASLSRDHAVDAPYGDTPAALKSDRPPATAPLIDLVLLRAVQLHRALLALKKL